MFQSTTILPLCSFAPASWCSIALNESCIIEAHENYPKQTYRNRYAILGPNGKQLLTIPVKGQKGIKTPIKDIVIAGTSWKKQHCGALVSAYGKSAFFEHYFDVVESAICSNEKFLIDFNLRTVDFLRTIIPLPALVFTTEYQTTFEGRDLRNSFEPSMEWPAMKSYPQVFSDRFEFVGGLSFLDLLFNLGPGMEAWMSPTATL